MSLNYRLTKRLVLNGPDKDKTKTYARAKTSGVTSLERLCKLVSARSAMSSADVKSVIDNLNWVMDLELEDGKIVKLGEFGNFRLSLCSEGVEDETKFNASMVKKARIIFTPGASLRSTRNNVGFIQEDALVIEKEVIKEVEIPCDKEHVFPGEMVLFFMRLAYKSKFFV